MTRRVILAMFAIAAVVGTAVVANADPAFPPGTMAFSVPAEADSYVQNGTFANTNFGSEALLMGKLYSNDTAWSRKAYIQFDVTTGDELNPRFPIPNQFYQLTLNVVDPEIANTVTDPEKEWEFSVYGFYGDTWEEDTITWNNAPHNIINSGNGVDTDNGAVRLGGFSIFGTGIGNVIEFRSSALDDFIDATVDVNEQYVNFIITRDTAETSGNNWVHAFAANGYDGVDGPFLSSVPEPATAMVWLVLGSLALGLSSWRRK